MRGCVSIWLTVKESGVPRTIQTIQTIQLVNVKNDYLNIYCLNQIFGVKYQHKKEKI